MQYEDDGHWKKKCLSVFRLIYENNLENEPGKSICETR